MRAEPQACATCGSGVAKRGKSFCSSKCVIMGNIVIDQKTFCWNWTGAVTRFGYGSASSDYGTGEVVAHRASYATFVGSIPANRFILHHCHNRLCVNPAHLRVGTAKQNVDDMFDAGRQPKCVGSRNGRAILTEDDVYLIKRDSRPIKVIAEAYGVKPSAIMQIRIGRNWKHVP